MSEIRIVTISDSDAFKQLAEHALANERGVVHETRGGGLAALADLLKDPPDILILHGACKEAAHFDALAQYTAYCPSTSVILACLREHKDPDMMIRGIHAGVKEYLFEPLEAGEIASVVKRLAADHKAAPKFVSSSEVMVFLPCKGGSGATFLSTNVAHILASVHKKRVLLMDLNLQFGDAYLYLMDEVPSSTLTDICTEFKRLDHAFLESSCTKLASGLRLLPAPRNPVDAEIVKPEHIEGILNLARMQFDFIVIDAGRNMDPVVIKALDLANHVYPVLQLMLPSLRDAKRLKDMFQELGYSQNKVRWILNRFGTKESLSLADVRRVLPEAYWTVPNDHESVTQSVNQGTPIVDLAPNSRCAKSLLEWVSNLLPQAQAQVTEQEKKQPEGLFGRLFGH
jgi:pilus assembly protein CpaE